LATLKIRAKIRVEKSRGKMKIFSKILQDPVVSTIDKFLGGDYNRSTLSEKDTVEENGGSP
jgi:hypothetical protein